MTDYVHTLFCGLPLISPPAFLDRANLQCLVTATQVCKVWSLPMSPPATVLSGAIPILHLVSRKRRPIPEGLF